MAMTDRHRACPNCDSHNLKAWALGMLKCGNCGASRSGQPIKSGFHAQAKGERKKARNKAGNEQIHG